MACELKLDMPMFLTTPLAWSSSSASHVSLIGVFSSLTWDLPS